MTNNNYWRGVAMVLGTTLCWGAMAPVAKLISSNGPSQVTVTCYRALFITVVVGAWLAAVKGHAAFRPGRRMFSAYALLGLFSLVFAATGNMVSCVYLTIPQALIIHYTYPLVTMVGSALFAHEKPSPIQVAAGFCIVAGLYIGFNFIHGGPGQISTAGVLWGALSVFGTSGQTLISRRISKTEKPDALLQLFFSNMAGGLILIVFKSVLSGWDDLSLITPKIFALMQYPAIAGSLLAFFLFYSSLKYIPAPTVSLVTSLEIIIALVLTPLLLHQMPSVHELAGCAIILVAVIVSTVSNARRNAARTAA